MPNSLYIFVRGHNPIHTPLPNGCYVETTDGSGNNEFFYPDQWDRTGILNSWIIISKGRSFKIHPVIQGGWGNSSIWYLFGGVNTFATGCTYTNYASEAITDYAGETNTNSILAAFGDNEPTNDSSVYPAKVCKETAFPDGSIGGWLPSLGELYLTYPYVPLIYGVMEKYNFGNISNYPIPYPSLRFTFYRGLLPQWSFTSTGYTVRTNEYGYYIYTDRGATVDQGTPSENRYGPGIGVDSTHDGYRYVSFGYFDNS